MDTKMWVKRYFVLEVAIGAFDTAGRIMGNQHNSRPIDFRSRNRVTIRRPTRSSS
jgi:hypothetical protein